MLPDGDDRGVVREVPQAARSSSRSAEKLNVAYATYERAGCYACHKTRGFEDLRKPGPILTKIDVEADARTG